MFPLPGLLQTFSTEAVDAGQDHGISKDPAADGTVELLVGPAKSRVSVKVVDVFLGSVRHSVVDLNHRNLLRSTGQTLEIH